MLTALESCLCRVALVLVVIGIANFIAFAIGSAVLGGEAAGGKIEHGHCYVGNHGKYTEVSETAFAYSKTHACSLWVTHPLAMMAMLVLFGFQQKRRAPASAPPPTASPP